MTNAPTIENLERFCELLVPMMRHNVEADGHLSPIVFLFASDGLHMLPLIGPLCDKDVAAQAVRDQVAKLNAWAVVHASEAWSATYDTSSLVVDLTREPSPANHPERREIVNVLCEHRNGDAIDMTLPMLRDGERVTLGEPERLRLRVNERMGRMTNFFGKGAAEA